MSRLAGDRSLAVYGSAVWCATLRYLDARSTCGASLATRSGVATVVQAMKARSLSLSSKPWLVLLLFLDRKIPVRTGDVVVAATPTRRSRVQNPEPQHQMQILHSSD